MKYANRKTNIVDYSIYINTCCSLASVMCHRINPLLPIAHKSARIDKISILKLKGIIKKISYERRDYESVDEKSLSKAMSQKTTKKNSGTKGLKQVVNK